MKTTELGRKGEAIAVQFLRQKDWQILVQNYRYRRSEIDIIAQDQKTTVFVEVKYRKSNRFGNPEEAVNKQKQQQIIQGATHFILTEHILNDIRFDIISILKYENKYQIQHFEDAFH